MALVVLVLWLLASRPEKMQAQMGIKPGPVQLECLLRDVSPWLEVLETCKQVLV